MSHIGGVIFISVAIDTVMNDILHTCCLDGYIRFIGVLYHVLIVSDIVQLGKLPSKYPWKETVDFVP